MANSMDPDQTAPIGAVCSGSRLFASILNSSVMLGNHLQQTTSADSIFRCFFFLGALRVKSFHDYAGSYTSYFRSNIYFPYYLLRPIEKDCSLETLVNINFQTYYVLLLY